jgi:hypothetical protein
MTEGDGRNPIERISLRSEATSIRANKRHNGAHGRCDDRIDIRSASFSSGNIIGLVGTNHIRAAFMA